MQGCRIVWMCNECGAVLTTHKGMIRAILSKERGDGRWQAIPVGRAVLRIVLDSRHQ